MRLGRIIVALLTPLVGWPALASGATHGQLPATPAADSLLKFLQSVAPPAVSTVDTSAHAQVSKPGFAASAFVPYIAAHFVAVWSPATEATLRLLERQQLRTQLRC
jgi:hypothetical protein